MQSFIPAGFYAIGVSNLPGGISWKELKDFIRNADGEVIKVDYVEINQKSQCGRIQFKQADSARRAHDFLWNRDWMGCLLEPYYLSSSPNDTTNLLSGRTAAGTCLPSGAINTYFGQPQLYPRGATYEQTRHFYDLSPKSPSVAYNSPFTNLPPGPFIQTESRGVHIKNLPYGVTDDELKTLVAQNLLVAADALKGVDLHAKKRYATVTFGTKDMADSAVEALDGLEYQGNPLLVKLDKNKQASLPQPVHQPFITHERGCNIGEGDSGKPPTTSSKPSYSSTCLKTVTSPRYNKSEPCDLGTAREQSNPRSSTPKAPYPPVVDGSKYRFTEESFVKKNEKRKTEQSGKGPKGRPSRGDKTS